MLQDEGIRLEVRRTRTSVIVAARGELDYATGSELQAAAREAAGDAPAVVVDLRELRFIDSSGLGTLLNLRGELRRRGIGFSVAVSDGPVRQALESTGLSELIDRGPAN